MLTVIVYPRIGGLPEHRLLRRAALALLVCVPLNAGAVEITAAGVSLSENTFLLDADAEIALPENVRTALDKGVDLYFLTNVRVSKIRKWLPDKTTVNFEIIRRLSFHALTKKYVVDDLTLKGRRSFSSAAGALSHLGRYRDIPLVSAELIKPAPDVQVLLRVRLMQRKLPLPLRLKRFFSRAWRLSSGWYALPLGGSDGT